MIETSVKSRKLVEENDWNDESYGNKENTRFIFEQILYESFWRISFVSEYFSLDNGIVDYLKVEWSTGQTLSYPLSYLLKSKVYLLSPSGDSGFYTLGTWFSICRTLVDLVIRGLTLLKCCVLSAEAGKYRRVKRGCFCAVDSSCFIKLKFNGLILKKILKYIAGSTMNDYHSD